MRFEHQSLLWLALAAGGALAAFSWWAWRTKLRLLKGFVGSKLLGNLTAGISPSLQKARMALAVVAVTFVLLALARPQWGFDWEEVRQRGLDVVVAIDTSRSMLAADIPPNRLARAKLAALDLKRLARADRVGLVAFAGGAFLQCPLSFDDEAFRQSVNALDVNIIPVGGSAIAEAIETARAAFKEKNDNHKVLNEMDHPRTRLVTISHVQYGTGQRHDLLTLGKFCRERGILFCVDAIQSLGALPVDVRAMNIDYLSADGHKWLLGPEGAGVFFCRQELLKKTRPALVGWMNVVNHLDYGNYDFTLKTDARKFECGTHNVPGLLALKASVELLLEVGVEAVTARIKGLTDRLAAGLKDVGCEVICPRGEIEWSGIVSFRPGPRDAQEVWTKLRKEHRTELALREGRLRASPHFYNTEEQIDRLVDALRNA